jgi:hypothetical protein
MSTSTRASMRSWSLEGDWTNTKSKERRVVDNLMEVKHRQLLFPSYLRSSVLPHSHHILSRYPFLEPLTILTMVTRTTASISISPSSDGTHPMSPQRTPAPSLQALIGEAHKRFVIVTTLLSLIDPVRGEPTPHSLDSHPHDASKPEQLQKKFLDSFALICSTSRKGADTASAVCLEQGHPHGNVLRLARNLGAPDDFIKKLQRVLGDLTAVALRGTCLSFSRK